MGLENVIAIPAGQNTVQVSGLGLASVPSAPSLTLLAPANPPDLIFAFLRGTTTTDGFTIGLSAPPSVNGYSVEWRLNVPGVPGPGSGPQAFRFRSCTFQSVLFGVARMLGLDTTRDLTAMRAGMLCEYINNRVKEAWEYDWWPEFTVREQRAYRQTWNAITLWQPGQHVLFHTPTYPMYFQALQAAVNQPPTDAQGNVNYAYWALAANGWSADPWAPNTQYALGQQILNPFDGFYYQCINPHVSTATINLAYFGRLVPFNRYIGYTQNFPAITGPTYSNGGATPLGRVKNLSVNDPFLATRNPGYIPFKKSDWGVQVNINAPAIIWVQFALREPVYTTTVWGSATPYTGSGELVYLPTTGNCYLSIAPGTNQNPALQPTFWQVVPFPLVLSNFVKRAALADALRDLKQNDRAALEENRAYEELSNAVDREIQSQSGSESAAVETYGRGRENQFTY